MFCTKCGKKSDSTKKFCSQCGSAFSISDNDGVNLKKTNSQSIPKGQWTTGRIIKTILAVIIVGGLILLKIFFTAVNVLDGSVVDKNNNAITTFESGGDVNSAITQLQQASKEAFTNENKVNSLKNLAYVYLSEEKNDLALSTFKEALPLAKEESLDYYLISGEIALLEGKPNNALLSFNKAYEIDPNDFQINSSLNLFYLDLDEVAPQYENYPKALTYALKAYELQPSETTKQNLAITYHFNEKYDNAITLFKSLTADKDSYNAYWIGLAYIGKDDSINAKIYLDKAIANGVEVPQEVIDYINSN